MIIRSPPTEAALIAPIKLAAPAFEYTDSSSLAGVQYFANEVGLSAATNATSVFFLGLLSSHLIRAERVHAPPRRERITKPRGLLTPISTNS